MEIQTKYKIGEQVFLLKKITKTACPVCNGAGTIRLYQVVDSSAERPEKAVYQTSVSKAAVSKKSGAEYLCPECQGKGTVQITGPKKYKMLVCKIVSLQFTISGPEIPPIIVYFVMDESGNVRKLTENQFYATREEAEKQLFFLNLERKTVNLNEVHIPHHFAHTIPHNEKLNQRLEEWRSHKKFKTEIYVDESMNLLDGYTSYLVYKMLGIDEIPVVVWPERGKASINKK